MCERCEKIKNDGREMSERNKHMENVLKNLDPWEYEKYKICLRMAAEQTVEETMVKEARAFFGIDMDEEFKELTKKWLCGDIDIDTGRELLLKKMMEARKVQC